MWGICSSVLGPNDGAGAGPRWESCHAARGTRVHTLLQASTSALLLSGPPVADRAQLLSGRSRLLQPRPSHPVVCARRLPS
jgi:hypothetical protein